MEPSKLKSLRIILERAGDDACDVMSGFCGGIKCSECPLCNPQETVNWLKTYELLEGSDGSED